MIMSALPPGDPSRPDGGSTLVLLRLIAGDARHAVDIDSTRSLAAALIMAVIGPAVFIVQPAFVGGMVEHLDYAPDRANLVASAEMWGVALTTVAMTGLAGRLHWRHAFAVSLLVVIAGNLACMAVQAFVPFAVTRFLVGLGSGGLVSLSFAAVGLTRNPDRNFGWLIMWVLIYGTAGMLVLPRLFELAGMNGALGFFALLGACGLPFVRWLPASGTERAQVDARAVDLGAVLKGSALAAMLAYFLAQGAVWTNLELIGKAGGVPAVAVTNGLAFSQFLGILGALTAALVGSRYGRAVPLALSLVAGIVPLGFLFGGTAALTYGAAVGVYNYAWNLTHPLLLAAMASFDRHGRVVVYAVAMQMLGLAIGPALAAALIVDDAYGPVLWLGMSLFALCLACILPPVLRQARLSGGGPAVTPSHPPLH